MVAGKNKEIPLPIEIEVKDAVPTSYRNILKEKKEESSQKRLVGVLYAACTFLAFVILMIGVAMMNNYDKIESLERLVSDLYKTAMGQVQQDNEDKQDVPVIDRVDGNVEPTSSYADTKEPESTPADVQIPEETSGGLQGDNIDNKKKEPESSTLTGQQSTELQSTEQLEEDTMNDGKLEDVDVQGGIRYHVVVEGDTLTSISRKFYNTDTMVDRIMEVNGIDDGNKIYPGQIIKLPQT